MAVQVTLLSYEETIMRRIANEFVAGYAYTAGVGYIADQYTWMYLTV